MDGYKHYIRLDADNNVLDGYTSAFPEFAQVGDICILEDGPRHFHEAWPEPLRNNDQQTIFKWIKGKRVQRPQAELDSELAARPPDPPTELDIVGQQLVEKDIQIMQLQTDDDVLGQQLVEIDIRMMMGGI